MKNDENIVYYHWWADPEEEPKCSNLRAPLLLSIATLRAVNTDCNIRVLDCSEQSDRESKKWLPGKSWPWDLQKKLDFRVFEISPYLRGYRNKISGWRHLSRLFDLRRNKISGINCHRITSRVVYCDSDVFWLQNPFPLSCDFNKFCYDGHNTGFFYYDSDGWFAPNNTTFLNTFESLTISSIVDKNIRALVKKSCPYDAWYDVWDEMITSHMRNILDPKFFHIIPTEEHVTCRNIHQADPDTSKMFHCNGTMVHNFFPKREGERNHSRGLMCLLVKEFYDNIRKVLDEDDLKLIFTPEEMDFYIPQQFSLFDLKMWDKMKEEDGHCHVRHVLRPPKTII